MAIWNERKSVNGFYQFCISPSLHSEQVLKNSFTAFSSMPSSTESLSSITNVSSQSKNNKNLNISSKFSKVNETDNCIFFKANRLTWWPIIQLEYCFFKSFCMRLYVYLVRIYIRIYTYICISFALPRHACISDYFFQIYSTNSFYGQINVELRS